MTQRKDPAERPGFRTSTTIGETLAEPEVAWAADVELISPEFLIFTYLPSEPARRLPQEAYLRHLLAADVDDPETLLVLCRAVGMLTLPPEDWAVLMGDPTLGIPNFRQRLERWDAVLERARKRPDVGESKAGVRVPVALDSVACSVSFLQALVRHWVAAADDTDPRDAWRLWLPKVTVKHKADWCWAMFESGLNTLLRPYAPAVRVTGYTTARFENLAVIYARPTPAQALGLQLYNAIVEALPVRNCPECGTRFVRQEGRALHDQFRTTGVTYCSRRCAAPQGQP